jgi:malate permease and related proteins
MTMFDSLLESLVILVALAGTAMWLRSRSSILREEEAVFGRLVTDFALPALIFTSLSREPFSIEKLLPALLLFGSIAAVMLAAWLVGRAMRLERPVLGSVILVAGAGSSSTLGYSLVHHVFGDNAQVMSKVVAMGEVGVVLPLFSFGVAIAVYFGRDRGETVSLWAASKPFFTSPIFFAIVLGLAASYVDIPREHWTTRLLDGFLAAAGDSLDLLVAFTIGLMLRPIEYRKIAALIAIGAGLKLIVEPSVALATALFLGIPALDRELLVLEAAMPSGTLAAVLAARYGCDGAAASAILVATYALSLLALPLIAAISF